MPVYVPYIFSKWHIGFFTHLYTPTYRGFDTFIGYYGDEEDYYVKNRTEDGLKGIDFRYNLDPYTTDGYSTYIYGNETWKILKEYVGNGHENREEPFFIYWASQAAHTPWAAPIEKIEQHNYLKNDNRRQLAAVVSTLDDVVGEIVDWLKSEDSQYLWEDLLLIVSTDNGGEVTKGASNLVPG